MILNIKLVQKSTKSKGLEFAKKILMIFVFVFVIMALIIDNLKM